MDFPKISSLSPSCIQPQETPKNRFEPFTFSKHFHHLNAWNAIEQRTPSCVGTALKMVLAIPVYLVEMVARAAEAIGNAGISALNGLVGRSVEVVDTSKSDLPPAKKVYDEPILKAGPLPVPAICAAELDVEQPLAPVELPTTTTTLVEDQPAENEGGWEWDVNNPDQIHVRYPEPVVPPSKSSYLKTALGVIGLAVVTLPALYYGYNYITSSGDEVPTHAWRNIVASLGKDSTPTYGCMQTPCDGSFECVDECSP